MLGRTWMACIYRPKVCLQHLTPSFFLSPPSLQPSGLGSSATVQNGGDVEDRLWVDKYKPSKYVPT